MLGQPSMGGGHDLLAHGIAQRDHLSGVGGASIEQDSPVVRVGCGVARNLVQAGPDPACTNRVSQLPGIERTDKIRGLGSLTGPYCAPM